MRWNGRNYRQVGFIKSRVNPISPVDTFGGKKLRWVDSLYFGTKTGGEAPQIVEVSIAPSSAVQYENVILSASTTGTSPTFIWTLTDFYDTSDTPITSFTGQILTEGYFTSTGSSNVSVSMVCDEGSGSNSTFSVSAFSPNTISDMFAWIDFSDNSTISYRTGTNYIESITDKTGNWTISQTTASYQPLMLTGGSADATSLLQVAQFDGIDNYMISNQITPITTFTAHTSFTLGTNKVKSGANEQRRRGCYWEIGRTASGSFGDRRALTHRPDLERIMGIGYGFNQDSYTTYNTGFTNYPLTLVIRRDATTGGDQVINDQPRTGFSAKNDPWYVRDFYISTQGNSGGNSTEHKLLGEYWESIHFSRDLDVNEEAQLDRYLQYKWFGSMNVI